MQFSPNFARNEFERPGTPIPDACLPVFSLLCTKILEPIREYIGKPVRITSGYRSAEDNKLTHGVSNSEHMATPDKCAADFTFDTTFGMLMSFRRVFDWIREGQLPFHQVILEHQADGSSIIHISINRGAYVRQALEGATHNASAYQDWEVATLGTPGEDTQV